MQLKDIALVIPKLVSATDCKLFISEYKRQQPAAKTEISLNSNTGQHQKSTCHVVNLSHEHVLYDLAAKYQEKALSIWLDYLDNFKCFNVPLLRTVLLEPHAIRIIRYKKGESIHPHTDWDHGTHASVTLNLNDDYTGGNFSFFNGLHQVSLGEGDALVFPADPFWTHSVEPVIEGTRYSINSFILSCNMEERHSIFKSISEKTNSRQPTYKLKK